jgi:hypothetical protein
MVYKNRMLAELKGLMATVPQLIADPFTAWKTLDILYEDPHVERVWLQLGPKRLNLHRIHPCERGFYHPHPWPSAICILEGRQRMTLGYGPPSGKPPDPAAMLDLYAPSEYEMLDPQGWHAVMPVGGPSLSLMLTGRPWTMPVMQHAQKAANRPLSAEARASLLADVARILAPVGSSP